MEVNGPARVLNTNVIMARAQCNYSVYKWFVNGWGLEFCKVWNVEVI
jgi:hypothetical protein